MGGNGGRGQLKKLHLISKFFVETLHEPNQPCPWILLFQSIALIFKTLKISNLKVFLSPKILFLTIFFQTGQPQPLFSFIFVYSKYSTEKFTSQQESNSDHQSSRQGRWPLYHHHDPFLFLNFLKVFWKAPILLRSRSTFAMTNPIQSINCLQSKASFVRSV